MANSARWSPAPWRESLRRRLQPKPDKRCIAGGARQRFKVYVIPTGVFDDAINRQEGASHK